MVPPSQATGDSRDGLWADGRWADGLWADGLWADGLWADGLRTSGGSRTPDARYGGDLRMGWLGTGPGRQVRSGRPRGV
ncbi:hypothetical protein KRMM14A1004_25460 [Krasilnikovia sp. MM14-A1004]